MPLSLVRRGGGILQKLPVNGSFVQPVRAIASQHQTRRIAFVVRRSSPITVASRLCRPGSVFGNPARAYATKGRPARKTTTQSSKSKKTPKQPKKKVAKKPAAKKPATRGRKPMTEKQRERSEAKKHREVIQQLRKDALTPPKPLPMNRFSLMIQDKFPLVDKTAYRNQKDAFKRAAEMAREATPAELQRYNERAQANAVANDEALKKWVTSHTALEIKNANHARLRLKKLLNHGKKLPPIQDDRLVRGPRTPYIIYSNEVRDKTNSSVTEESLTIGNAWRNLSDSEKKVSRSLGGAAALKSIPQGANSWQQKYYDLAKADRERYEREHLEAYGVPYTTRKLKANKE